MPHVVITSLNLVGAGERGNTYDFSLRETSDFIYITRIAGSMNGNTYHEGVSDKTNPKIFILLSGEIEFYYRHIEETELTTQKVTAPAKIEIQPKVTHAMKAITDITVLECNGFKDIANDRYRLSVLSEQIQD